MARILFIEPELRTDKLGSLYLSAILKQAGHDVDLVMDIGGWEIGQAILADPPGFLMYSVATGNHQWYIKRNRQLKTYLKFKDYKSIFGGPHFTYFPEDGINDPDIDYVVQGPADEIITQLVENPPGEKLIRGNVPLDINEFPPPDRSILYKYSQFGQSRMKRFIAGRDCPNACTYCFNHLYHRMFKAERKRFYQLTTPRRMIDEVKAVKANWGLELAYFNDDDLARDSEWLSEFCRLFKDEAGIEFCGSVRADSLDEGMVQMMSEAGCSFMNIALESAVPSTQKMLRRGRVKNTDIAQACKWFHKYGIKVRLQNMVGLAVDDPVDDALATLAFNQALPVTDSWASVFMPFKYTDAWQQCLDMNLITESTDTSTFFDDTVLAFDELTQQRINALGKWWYYLHKWKLSRKAVLGLIDIPLANEQKQLIQQARWREAARVLYGMRE